MFIDTQVRPQGELVDAVAPSKMKLSAAIRIGARLRPQQCFGTYFDGVGTCAIGAAWEGSGHVAMKGVGILVGILVTEHFGLSREITRGAEHRNDDLKESRESIADWLE